MLILSRILGMQLDNPFSGRLAMIISNKRENVENKNTDTLYVINPSLKLNFLKQLMAGTERELVLFISLKCRYFGHFIHQMTFFSNS